MLNPTNFNASVYQTGINEPVQISEYGHTSLMTAL